jgi:peroxiredoxin Q/BCP
MKKLNPGDQAPAFSLPDQNGQRVKLGDFKGQKLLLSIFLLDR